MNAATKSVVLFGKVGHGKTYLINKMCGTCFKSTMQSDSCTRLIQIGYTAQYGIRVIDTPGFFSSDDIVKHVSEQKRALEEVSNSGIYVVVKVGRADEINDIVNRVMDFTGSDDVRLIITHADTVTEAMGFDPHDLKHELFSLLDIPTDNMLLVGAQSTGDEIEKFIQKTLHSCCVSLSVSKEQFIYASTFGVGAAKYNRSINETVAKIQAAVDACEQLLHRSPSHYGHMSSLDKATISGICVAVDTMVRDDEHYLLQISSDLSPKQHAALLKNFKKKVADELEILSQYLPLRSSFYHTEAYFIHTGTKWKVAYKQNENLVNIPKRKKKEKQVYTPKRKNQNHRFPSLDKKTTNHIHDGDNHFAEEIMSPAMHDNIFFGESQFLSDGQIDGNEASSLVTNNKSNYFLPHNFWTCRMTTNSNNFPTENCTICNMKGVFGICVRRTAADASYLSWCICKTDDAVIDMKTSNLRSSRPGFHYDSSYIMGFLNSYFESFCVSTTDTRVVAMADFWSTTDNALRETDIRMLFDQEALEKEDSSVVCLQDQIREYRQYRVDSDSVGNSCKVDKRKVSRAHNGSKRHQPLFEQKGPSFCLPSLTKCSSDATIYDACSQL